MTKAKVLYFEIKNFKISILAIHLFTKTLNNSRLLVLMIHFYFLYRAFTDSFLSFGLFLSLFFVIWMGLWHMATQSSGKTKHLLTSLNLTPKSHNFRVIFYSMDLHKLFLYLFCCIEFLRQHLGKCLFRLPFINAQVRMNNAKFRFYLFTGLIDAVNRLKTLEESQRHEFVIL